MSESRKVTGAAGIVGGLTIISRVLGYVRDKTIAHFFGGDFWYTDVFFASFEIPNLFRRLLGEGALSAAFITVFTDYDNKKGREAAIYLARAVFNLLLALVTVMVVIGIIITPLIIFVILLGYDFRGDAEAIDTAIHLTRIMFPYLGFIALAGLFMGALNSMGHFAMPAFSPVMLNLSLIASAFLICPLFGDTPAQRLTGLAIGVLVGGFLQSFIQVIPLYRRGLTYKPIWDWHHPGVRRIAKMLLPALFGLGVTQFNIVVDKICASFIGEGSISALFYGGRLVQLPEAIFGIAVAVAVLPVAARLASKREFTQLGDTLSYGIRLIMFLTIPASIGLIIMREPIIALLYQGGAFSQNATAMVSWALLFYALGLLPFSCLKTMVPIFYALDDVWTPVKVGFAAFFINVAGNLLLMGPLKHGGLALATVISAVFNLCILGYILRRRVGLRFGLRKLLDTGLRVGLASVLMGALAWFLWHTFTNSSIAQTFIIRGLATLAIIAVCIVFYIIAAKLLRVPELNEITKIVKDKFAR